MLRDERGLQRRRVWGDDRKRDHTPPIGAAAMGHPRHFGAIPAEVAFAPGAAGYQPMMGGD
jgi:hypothetical protein